MVVHLLEGHKGKPAVVSAVREGDSVRVTRADGARETFRWQGGDDPGQPTTCTFVLEEHGTLTHAAFIQGQHGAEGDRVLLSYDRLVKDCSVEFQGEEAHVNALESGTIELLPPRPMRRVLVNGREVPWERVEGRIKVEVIIRNYSPPLSPRKRGITSRSLPACGEGWGGVCLRRAKHP